VSIEFGPRFSFGPRRTIAVPESPCAPMGSNVAPLTFFSGGKTMIQSIPFLCGLCITLLVSATLAQTTTAPTTAPSETMKLWPADAPMANGQADADVPTLAVFLPDKAKANGCGIVVCPGGGYSHLAMGHEGYDVANWLKDNGIAAFVLKYRIKPYQQPVPMLDGQRAVRLVRSHAAEWGVDPNRLGVIGFSAGGHVASTLGTHLNGGKPDAPDPVDRLSARPDFMILCYPVISMKEPIAHAGSRKCLLGDNPTDALVEKWSNEMQVTDQTPPAFIVHSKTDTTVKVINSELFYQAMQAHHIPSELLVLETGRHGWGLAPKNPELAVWKEKCLDWMNRQRLLAVR
jgi:acetyl esterase/lipase